MKVDEIRQCLQQYFDGLYFADANLLAEVFHPKAHYTSTTSGVLQHLSMPEYFEIVRQRFSPAEQNQQRQDAIISIDIVGEKTALAKVRCVLEPKYFTDFLSLIFIDGRWHIISKVFHYQLTPF